MVGQQQPATRAQDPVHFADRGIDVRDRAQPKSAHHGVERCLVERQSMRIAVHQSHRALQIRGSAVGDRQQLLAQIQAGELDTLRIPGKIQAGTHGHFEGLPGGPRAHPLASVLENSPVHKPHLLVVAIGLLIPVALQLVTAVTDGCHVPPPRMSPAIGMSTTSPWRSMSCVIRADVSVYWSLACTCLALGVRRGRCRRRRRLLRTYRSTRTHPAWSRHSAGAGHSATDRLYPRFDRSPDPRSTERRARQGRSDEDVLGQHVRRS